jgi:hypothetical protein
VTTADNNVIHAMFRLMAHAQVGRIRYVNIDASAPNGIAGITMVAMPTAYWDRMIPHDAEKLEHDE